MSDLTDRPHIVDGEFQSDKYPTCPAGKVPLSVKDLTAQDLLWEYAQRRRIVDAEFADDLEFALTRAGYVHRAAQSASKERVREVVKAACLAIERTAVTAVPIEKLDLIIDRAADQLAMPADRKPSLAEQRAAHGMRTPSEEERRENIESITSEVTAGGLLTVEPTTAVALSTEDRVVLQRMRAQAARSRGEWLGWPTEKMYADEVALLDRLLAVSALAPSALSAEELRGMQLMRLHLDDGGHDWREGTAMADVQATCLALDRLLGGKP